MHVTVTVQQIGNFTKRADKNVIPNGFPPRLNESSHLYGRLSEEMDLSIGCEGFKDEGYGDRLQSTFSYLQQTSSRGSSMEKVINADFVSNRRVLKVIAETPYCLDPIEIQAIRQNGIIFLCDRCRDFPDSSSPQGHKFEQYMTLGKNGLPRDKYEKVSNAECSKVVLRTTITSGKEKIKVLYSAEMDSVDKKGNFVELKSTAMTHTRWLEKASLKHYLQSYLAGVPYIIYGRKISWNVPIVYKTDKIKTEDIPKENVRWRKEVCFEQLFKVLQKIQSKLEYDDEALVVNITKEGIFFEPECSANCTFMNSNFLNHFDQ